MRNLTKVNGQTMIIRGETLQQHTKKGSKSIRGDPYGIDKK